MAFRKITAVFRSNCGTCKAEIKIGDTLYHDPMQARGKKAICVTCFEKQDKEKKRKAEKELGKGIIQEMYERSVRAMGQEIPVPFGYQGIKQPEEKPKKDPRDSKEYPIVSKSLYECLSDWENYCFSNKRCKLKENQRAIEEKVSCDREDFTGKSLSDMRKAFFEGVENPDTEIPEALKEKLVLAFGEKGVKTLVRDEYDGNVFNADNLFSDKPFSRRKVIQKPTPIVEIEVHMAASAFVEAEEYLKAGKFLAACINSIEASGVLCGLTLSYRIRRFNENSSNRDFRIRVKNPQDYVAPSVINAICTPYFFRGPIFAQIIQEADESKTIADYGLGRPENVEHNYFDNGLAVITLGDLTNNPESLIDGFIKSINQ